MLSARQDPQSRVVLALTLALLVFGLWRVGYGVDRGDGAHVVALAVRLAEGDRVFVDEMNAQALGSLLAVPFTWVWLQVVGLEGIVLASRVWYLVLALTAGAISYRALRTGFRPLAAFTGAALALTPTAYNLLVTSYNTMPLLALGTAVFSGYAALRAPSARWAAVSGAALALSVLSHPSSLPGAAVLGVTILLLGPRRPGVVRGLLAGGLGTSAVVVAWALATAGLPAIRETLEYTAEYQAARPHPLTRLLAALDRFAPAVWSWDYLPALVLVLVACLPHLPPRWRAVAVMAVPLVVAAGVARTELASPGRLLVGTFSGTYAIIVALALLLPVCLWAARTGQEVRLLLVLATPLAVIGFLSYSAVSSAHVAWGATSPPVMALYGVVGLAVVTMVEGSWRSWVVTASASVVLLGSLGLVSTLRSFRDPGVWEATVRITGGANAGLLTTAGRAADDCEARRAIGAWVGPDESLLAYQDPAAYLDTEARMDTNIIWLAQFGGANQHALDWISRTGRWPAAVVVHPAAWQEWETLVTEDPLLREISASYGEPVETSSVTVLRRDGATSPPNPGATPRGCPSP